MMPASLPAFRRQSLLFSMSGLLLMSSVLVLYGHQYGWFERSLTIYMVVSNSQGLRIGTPVRLSGLPVGMLEGMKLDADGRVRLELRVPHRYRHWITPRSIARLTRDGLLGDWLVELSPAPMSANQLPTRFVVETQSSPNIEELLAGVEATRVDLQKLLVSSRRVADRDLPSTLAQLNTTLAGGRSLSAQINRELVPTANQLRTMLSTADETAKSATRTANRATQIMQELRPDLVMALKELSSAMRRTNRLLDQFGVLPLPSSENSAAPPSPIDHSSLQRSSSAQKQ